jgi:phage terminase large subunit-like protein
MSLDSDLMAAFEHAATMLEPKGSEFTPFDHFKSPMPPWYLWMLFGGRGSGKTAHGAKYVHDHVHGPPCLPHVPGGHWISIVAPTLGDAVTSCVEGPSGLRAHDPGIKVLNRPGGIIARWSNGAEAKLFGAHSPEDVERFRAGGNRCLVWMEEFAAWRYLEESYQQIRYGLRVGPRPHMIATTTPRSRKLIKSLVKDSQDPAGKTRLSVGTMYMNPHLPIEIKEQLEKDYAGTRMGRQELYGELLEDTENALWTGEQLDALRPHPWQVPEEYDRIVVAVDPAASENGDENGIVVGGVVYKHEIIGGIMNGTSHGFILEDCSLRGSPNEWAKRAVRAYQEHKADLIVAEKNNGGDMVAQVIKGVDDRIPVKLVHASRGKTKRAEPVANLYSQFRVHHVGMFPELEDQMVGWDAKDPDPAWSPDRMDAMVWCITELMLDTVEIRKETPKDTRLANRR